MMNFSVVGWGVIAAVGLGTGVVRAELLPIVNPGFEDLNVALRPGEQTSGAGGGIVPVSTTWRFPFTSAQGAHQPQSGVLVPGWRTNTAGGGSLAGVLRPDVTFGGMPWMTGYSGSHIAAAQAAQMQQTLNVQLQANTRYTLSFLAGIGITDSEYAPLIGLLAAPDLETPAFSGTPGVITLARAPLVSIQREDFGVMRPFSFSTTTPEVLPSELVGKYIAISFLGSDGIPRMCYDEFRLEAVVVPGAGSGAVLMGGAGVMLARGQRRRGAGCSRP